MLNLNDKSGEAGPYVPPRRTIIEIAMREPEVTVSLPVGAEFLCLRVVDNSPTLFFLVELPALAALGERRRFAMVPRSGRVSLNGYLSRIDYLGTAGFGGHPIHVFEVGLVLGSGYMQPLDPEVGSTLAPV